MRAKEYLEINKSMIQYYDIVKSAIDALCPLRNDKRKTEEYFNKYLFADARYKAQKDGFALRKGEVQVDKAPLVRIDIMNAIFYDDSFIYAHNIIVMQKNKYHDILRLKFCNLKDINRDTISKIERICSLYKEDYPKQHLCDFLIDDLNQAYFQSKNCLKIGGLDWWCDVYNKTYEQFDIIRVKLVNGFDEHSFLNSICTGNEKMDYEVIELVSYLFKNYSYDLDEVQIKKYVLLSESLKITFNQMHSVSNVVAEPEVNIKINEEDSESEIDKLKIEIDRLKSENERLKDSNIRCGSSLPLSREISTKMRRFKPSIIVWKFDSLISPLK